MKHNRLTTHAVISVILLNVFVFAALGLLFYEVGKKNQQISSIQNEIEFESKKIDRLAKLQDLVETTAADREELDGYFLSKDGVVSFISQLEQLGKDAGTQVELSDIREEPIKNETYDYLVVNATVGGRWEEIIQYVTLLENMPYILELENLNFHMDEGATAKLDAIWTGRVLVRVLTTK